MNHTEIYEKLNNVFRDVFDDGSIVVKENTTAADIEDWDSLMHVNLVVSVERTFGIKLSMGDVLSFENVGDMVAVIEREIK